ncbi:MAG: hypothetical protein O9337_21560 [Acidovorax sp.]|jgi:hypothetical protein|uniref:hypothetical protein n=1 Tax=Acidovorax sp. TaxID=1872122 RepID=UPI0022C97EDF|nr:hypothetical protein [Acidovorax sp.]MCZ8222017.1 hypothetical protein [Acidovorax sp.]
MKNPSGQAHKPPRYPGMGIADRLLTQLQGVALGGIAQALVVVGVQVGLHGIPFGVEPL